jgi:hypothetical protein
MNKLTRRLGTLALAGAAAMMLVGCGSKFQGGNDDGPGSRDTVGELALPLVTQGASGVTYRLRDAIFAIHSECYIDADAPAEPVTGGSGGVAGTGSGGGCGDTTLVSSEDDPAAMNLTVSLLEGSYYIELLPGWHFEKNGPMGAEPVEATLLSGETQWLWVSRQSTTFAEYRFGLGGLDVWLNGQVNIGIQVCEDPNLPCYGGMGGYGGYTGGAAGAAGAAGTASGGTGAVGTGGAMP